MADTQNPALRAVPSSTSERADAERERELELRRLDAMFQALGPTMTKGSVSAINTGLRILERRARLTSLESEQRSGPAETTPAGRPYAHLPDDELDERIVSRLLALLPERQAAAVRAALDQTGGFGTKLAGTVAVETST